MTRTLKIMLGLGVILVIAGVTGTLYGRDIVTVSARSNFNLTNAEGEYPLTEKSSTDTYVSRSRINRLVNENTGEKMSLEILKDKVNDFISYYDEALEISDIFVFDDGNYYFSIVEKETGLGAMELLVNPYNGEVYPEFGPNMMWNIKYGMHNGNMGYGMMARNGYRMSGNSMMGNSMMGNSMMGNGYGYRENNTELINNTIDFDKAVEIARTYIEQTDKDYAISGDGHQFYGYYTLHVEKNNSVVGMISVNGFTSEVWYHDWHSTIAQVIEANEGRDGQ